MKKLMMFAAAMTIVGGAYAQCSDPVLENCMAVYNVKMNLKTVGFKTGKLNSCDDAMCVRWPKVGLVLEGYMVLCSCDCDGLTDADNATLFLGNKKLQSVLLNDTFAFDFLHVLGNGKQAEASWTYLSDTDYREIIGPMQLQGTGFGTFSPKYSTYTAFSGGVTGHLLNPRCTADCADFENSFYWLCDGTEDDSDASVIYGTWGMKVNTKATGYKYSGRTSQVMRALMPAWAFNQFAEAGAFDFIEQD